MYPLMNKKEIKEFKKALDELSTEKNELKILEWGSGGSTVYFTEYLKSKGVRYKWLSIEYNKNWYEKVKERVKDDSNIEIKLFDVGNNRLKQVNSDMDEYVKYPSELDEKFDLILVDGRKRRRCVLEAKKFLSQGGVVYLHDAQRRYYHSAFPYFPDQRFVSMFFWRGKNERVSFKKKIKNKIATFFYRFLFIVFVAPMHFLKRRILKLRRKIKGY